MRLLSGECDRIALCSLTAVHGCVWSSNFLKVLDAAKFDVETNEAALASAKAGMMRCPPPATVPSMGDSNETTCEAVLPQADAVSLFRANGWRDEAGAS